MANIYDRDGVAFLEGELFDLKIDGARKIYYKTKTKNSFVWSGHYCDRDMPIDRKKEFLNKYNQLLEMKFREDGIQNRQQK